MDGKLIGRLFEEAGKQYDVVEGLIGRSRKCEIKILK